MMYHPLLNRSSHHILLLLLLLLLLIPINNNSCITDLKLFLVLNSLALFTTEILDSMPHQREHDPFLHDSSQHPDALKLKFMFFNVQIYKVVFNAERHEREDNHACVA